MNEGSQAIVVVISPLLSLMIDQVKFLQDKGVRAAFLREGQDDETVKDRVEWCLSTGLWIARNFSRHHPLAQSTVEHGLLPETAFDSSWRGTLYISLGIFTQEKRESILYMVLKNQQTPVSRISSPCCFDSYSNQDNSHSDHKNTRNGKRCSVFRNSKLQKHCVCCTSDLKWSTYNVQCPN